MCENAQAVQRLSRSKEQCPVGLAAAAAAHSGGGSHVNRISWWAASIAPIIDRFARLMLFSSNARQHLCCRPFFGPQPAFFVFFLGMGTVVTLTDLCKNQEALHIEDHVPIEAVQSDRLGAPPLLLAMQHQICLCWLLRRSPSTLCQAHGAYTRHQISPKQPHPGMSRVRLACCRRPCHCMALLPRQLLDG